MPNSPKSEKVVQSFDQVLAGIREALEERLWDTWQTGDEEPKLGQQLSLDITFIGTALHARKKGLTDAQYAFLGDLFDHASGPDAEKMTTDQHKSRIEQLAENEIFWEPPTVLLNLLRGYDAMNKTETARAYKDLLSEIAKNVLEEVEKPTETDKELLERFELTWSEVLIAARAPENRLNKDSTELIDEINNAVVGFMQPTREVIESIEELRDLDALRNIEGFIRRSFTNYLAQAVLVDDVVHPKELELLTDLAPTLGIYGHLGSVENLKSRFEQVSQKVSPSDVPLLVTILDIFDEDHEFKTNLGHKCRALFLRLTGTVFGVDLDVDPDELIWFNQFKAALFPPETARVAE